MGKKKMQRFLISCDVTSVEGSQTWYVDARNENEALTKYKDGEGDFYAEELEVQDLGSPTIVGTTELDDCGDLDPKTDSDAKRFLFLHSMLGMTPEQQDEITSAMNIFEDAVGVPTLDQFRAAIDAAIVKVGK